MQPALPFPVQNCLIAELVHGETVLFFAAADGETVLFFAILDGETVLLLIVYIDFSL